MDRGLLAGFRAVVAGWFGFAKVETLRISDESHPDWTGISRKKFALKHPDGLRVDHSGLMGTEFVVFLGHPTDPDEFCPNINLQIQPLGGRGLDLDRYTDISVDQVKRLVSNSKLITNMRKNGLKGEYQQLVYAGDQGKYHLQFEQFLAIAHGNAYVLTLTCEQTHFDRCRGPGEAIMDTFVLR